MISPFTLKREHRTRNGILKGVYEENLRILGKGRNMPSGSRPFYLRKVFLTLLITTLAVFFHARYGAVPFSSESPVTADVIANKPASVVVAKSHPSTHPDVSAYKAIMHEPGMPLRSIFGLGVKTIMLDPGHGGIDRGTAGKLGTKEKDLTLDIAKRLKALLEQDGRGRYRVLLTRDRDETVPLNERVEMSRAEKADIFVSIHFNYLPHDSKDIIETYYFGPSSDEKALRLAEKENAGSHYGMSDFRRIIENLGQTMKLQESRKLAGSIQKDLFVNMERQTGAVYNYGVKRAPFVVLLGAQVPAVLVEVSCLSNRAEEKRLDTKGYRENIAHYLEAGILDYLNKGDTHYEEAGYAKR